MRSFILAGTLASLAIASAANAATITQTFSYDKTPNFTKNFSVARFDPSLGTLNSVSVSLGLAVVGGSYSVDNDSPDAASGNASFGTTISLTGTGVHLLDQSSQPVISPLSLVRTTAFSVTGDTDNGTHDFQGTDAATFAGFSDATNGSGTVSSAFLTDYVGNTSFSVTLKASREASTDVDGGLAELVIPQSASGTLTVVYNYTLVPEPATVGVMAMAGLVFVGGRRRAVKGR